IDLEDLGEQSLKNMGQARVYRVRLPDTYERPPDSASLRRIASFRGRPAIAVLPFKMSPPTDDEHFADGVTEDIITELGSWRSFPVIGRNSVFAYKGATTDLTQVGRELGAGYILHGSVRRDGSKVRIIVELTEAESSTQVFSNRYDRTLEDIFAV